MYVTLPSESRLIPKQVICDRATHLMVIGLEIKYTCIVRLPCHKAKLAGKPIAMPLCTKWSSSGSFLASTSPNFAYFRLLVPDRCLILK